MFAFAASTATATPLPECLIHLASHHGKTFEGQLLIGMSSIDATFYQHRQMNLKRQKRCVDTWLWSVESIRVHKMTSILRLYSWRHSLWFDDHATATLLHWHTNQERKDNASFVRRLLDIRTHIYKRWSSITFATTHFLWMNITFSTTQGAMCCSDIRIAWRLQNYSACIIVIDSRSPCSFRADVQFGSFPPRKACLFPLLYTIFI